MTDPGTTVSLTNAIVGGTVSLVSGLLIKMLWDILRATDKYVTPVTCKQQRENCPVVAELTKEFLIHKAHMEERIDRVTETVATFQTKFDRVAKDMSKIQTDMAVVSTWLKLKDRR